MTLEEKTKLVVGMGFKITLPPGVDSIPGLHLPPTDPEDDRIPEKVAGAAGRTHAIPRLGIPSLTVSDGPAGIRINPIRNNDSSKTYYATAFPVGTLLASSWDTTLLHKVGAAFGNEVREYGTDIILGPALNIQRNPLGGRNFEYYSEDPVVTGHITAAIVNGFQSSGIGTSIKHFAANNQETNRMQVNTVVSERALREIYLKGFEIAIKEAQPWTVMSSYNLINGTYTSQRRDLLTTILRNEWGFKGFVMTDWWGGKDPIQQMNAGNDLIMPGGPDQSKAIATAVQNGTISMQQLDENVTHILNIILQSPTFKKYPYSNHPDAKAHALVSRQAATESMILLRNNNKTLPLATNQKIAVFGNTAYDLIAGGTGSGDVNKAYVITPAQGFTNAGYNVDETWKNNYTTYVTQAKATRKPISILETPPPIPEMPIDPATLAATVSTTDAAIITIGRNAGEGADRKLEGDYYLTPEEKTLLQQIANTYHEAHKKVIVILNIGGVIEIASWRNLADAILLAWQPGQEGGNAIGDIISGKVNPSGKLATTFPMDYKDVPSASTFPGKELPVPTEQMTAQGFLGGKPAEVTYDEGIYVGYRYYNTFHVQPAYEFGYGMSYTTFTYSGLTLNSNTINDTRTARVTITNNGPVAGKEVVQLYISAPANKTDKPAEELKAFAKTNLLQPGKSQTITFTIHTSDLASYNTNASAWIAEAGKYQVKIGASSINILQSATFNLPVDKIAEKDTPLLTPQVNIKELKP